MHDISTKRNIKCFIVTNKLGVHIINVWKCCFLNVRDFHYEVNRLFSLAFLYYYMKRKYIIIKFFQFPVLKPFLFVAYNSKMLHILFLDIGY